MPAGSLRVQIPRSVVVEARFRVHLLPRKPERQLRYVIVILVLKPAALPGHRALLPHKFILLQAFPTVNKVFDLGDSGLHLKELPANRYI